MNVLGISGLYHDSAAALVSEGEIIAAVQEERFTRKKHDKRFPIKAIEYCLGLGYEIDAVVYYDNPLYTLERQLDNLYNYRESFDSLYNVSLRDMLEQKIWIHKSIQKVLRNNKVPIYVATHHMIITKEDIFTSEERNILLNYYPYDVSSFLENQRKFILKVEEELYEYPYIYNASHLLDDEEGYWDFVHYNILGNTKLSEYIYNIIFEE